MAGSSESQQAWVELLGLGSGGADHDDDHALALALALVADLQRRGEPEVVDWALPMLASADLWHRKAAAWVLGQHGFSDDYPFCARVMPALAAAARTEADDETRAFFVSAMGFAADPSSAEELRRYATDPFAPIRESVAAALSVIFADEPMTQAVINSLIDLTRDRDRWVRDWATMSLGGQTKRDSDEIRAALRDRLDDDDDSEFDYEDGDNETATKGEAALGLALRRDPSVLPYLRRWLAAPAADVGSLTIEAAGVLGDRRLLPALLDLQARDWASQGRHAGLPGRFLEDAIAALEQTRPWSPTATSTGTRLRPRT